MSKKVKGTKRLRVRLDFTIELPVEVTTLPVGRPEWARHITDATAIVLPGARVGIGLDFRPAKGQG